MEPSLPLLLAILVLAAARITHLLTTDTISQPLRTSLEPYPFFDELIHCPWCIGFWVSVLAVIAFLLLPPNITFLLSLPWAISYIVGFLESL